MTERRTDEGLKRDLAILYEQAKLCSKDFKDGQGIFDLSTYPQRLLVARLEGMVEGIFHSLHGSSHIGEIIKALLEGKVEKAIDWPALKDSHSQTGLVYLNDALKQFDLRYGKKT